MTREVAMELVESQALESVTILPDSLPLYPSIRASLSPHQKGFFCRLIESHGETVEHLNVNGPSPWKSERQRDCHEAVILTVGLHT